MLSVYFKDAEFLGFENQDAQIIVPVQCPSQLYKVAVASFCFFVFFLLFFEQIFKKPKKKLCLVLENYPFSLPKLLLKEPVDCADAKGVLLTELGENAELRTLTPFRFMPQIDFSDLEDAVECNVDLPLYHVKLIAFFLLLLGFFVSQHQHRIDWYKHLQTR